MLTFEYEAIDLSGYRVDLYKELLDCLAKGGWRLITVDNGVAYFERAFSM